MGMNGGRFEKDPSPSRAKGRTDWDDLVQEGTKPVLPRSLRRLVADPWLAVGGARAFRHAGCCGGCRRRCGGGRRRPGWLGGAVHRLACGEGCLVGRRSSCLVHVRILASFFTFSLQRSAFPYGRFIVRPPSVAGSPFLLFCKNRSKLDKTLDQRLRVPFAQGAAAIAGTPKVKQMSQQLR